MLIRAPAKQPVPFCRKGEKNDSKGMDHDWPGGGHRGRKYHSLDKREEEKMIIVVKRFNRVENGGKLKGFADVTLDGSITIHGVRLMDSVNGLFAGMPRRKEKDGKYHDIVGVEDSAFRQEITNALIQEYQRNNNDIHEEWMDADFEIYE